MVQHALAKSRSTYLALFRIVYRETSKIANRVIAGQKPITKLSKLIL